MFDIIVVGGGHAGIEAALAGARMKMKTALITTDFSNVGQLPCNTSIGGPAKGIVVREIDALGGQMGITTDHTYLQMKMLNTAKGPGVQSLRAQVDKVDYPLYMQKVIKEQENLTVIEDTVENLIVEDGKAKGVYLENNNEVYAKMVILTTGTYMRSRVLIGDEAVDGGPNYEKNCKYLSTHLKEDFGFELMRLKTGTPPRVHKDSVDYSKTQVQPGTDAHLAFSYTTNTFMPIDQQIPCYLTYTNTTTHDLIQNHLQECSMYSGLIEGVGPRYCPSIETKIVRFADKNQHQIFLEPESLKLDTIYVQGFSNSMPRYVQDEMIKTIPGLEQCEILKYAYAIEYDAVNPLQLYPSLETKLVENLFTAGQINGTSGYEEAAAQGLMAGINATLKIKGEEPLILGRDDAYIGVMIDDLVTKGTQEPYRLLTSRAEYRLLLRHDNADERLSGYGYQVGLLSQERYQAYRDKKQHIQDEINRLETIRFTPKHEINNLLEQIGSTRLTEGISAKSLIQRPEMKYEYLREYIDGTSLTEEEIHEININIKYAGYIEKAKRQVEKMKKLDEKKIPKGIDYQMVPNLSLEARQKLEEIQPVTVGQASRISGINPSDISVLLIYLKVQGKEHGIV